ncbi:DUF2239 family protein [Rhodopseudomonas sp. B29]|uniref:DUF2239 family protein n=1 Tax=Rhodopseudomonas sp. B29 TaxID=95607 RepID=UPI0003B7BB98|nr:DUF2239 family protein [Rhodopseudomonas sp. B29]
MVQNSSDSARSSRPCTAFDVHRLLHAGPLADIALAVKSAAETGRSDCILVFDDATGRVVDLDLRGTDAEVIERLGQATPKYAGRYRPASSNAPGDSDDSAPRSRGRPKLGVVSREVTLLPSQWAWLAEQPGGASSVLRRLVDDARRNASSPHRQRAAREAAYNFMHAIAGDFPGYEEATRALFAGDRHRLEQYLAEWPKDVSGYALRLAFGPHGDGGEVS